MAVIALTIEKILNCLLKLAQSQILRPLHIISMTIYFK